MSIIQWARNGGVGDVLPNDYGWSQLALIQSDLSNDFGAQATGPDAQRQKVLASLQQTFDDAALRSQDQLDGAIVSEPMSVGLPAADADASNPGINAADIARERAKLNRQCDAARRTDVFTEDYLMGMPGTQIHGAGNQNLSDAMTVLQGERDPQSGKWKINASTQRVEDSLRAIAAARDVPLEEIRIDFDRFKDLAAGREQAADSKPGARTGRFDEKDDTEARVPMLAMGAPGDIADNHAHMGSSAQLRFGKMIGDTLGLDPVFGALLSPTGGIAGPGNRVVGDLAFAAGGGKEVVVNHGIAHDAGGYLYNYHDRGPGYQYVPNMPFHILDRGNPLGGQKDGINLFYNFKNYNRAVAPRFNGEI